MQCVYSTTHIFKYYAVYRYTMFTLNETYWFIIRGKLNNVTIKGKVVEEDSFMVKIITDRDNEFIIIKANIIDVNKDRGYGSNTDGK